MQGQLPCKITRTIIRLGDLELKIHIKLIDEDFESYSEFEYNGKRYARFDPNVFLILSNVKNKDSYSTDKNLVINQLSINPLIKGLKKVQRKLYDEEIFYMQDNVILAYADMVNKSTEQIKMLKSNQVVVVRPAVVYDENNISYEGVNLYINNPSNVIELTNEEFDVLIYTLSQIDLYSYSQLLINYMETKYANRPIEVQSKSNQKHNRKKINWDEPPVESNFRKPSDNDLFAGLNNKEETK